MLTVIVVAGLALAAGILLGWLLRAPRVHRAEVGRAVAETRIEESERARASVTDTFVVEAQRAFQQVSESLVQMNKTQIDGSLDTKRAEIETLLMPVREMLDQYRGEVQKSERVRNEAYGGLQQQILTLLSAQQLAQREASRLANALQSPAVRGSWGENSLTRCVELAGLSEFCDFDMQETFSDDEGRRLRPALVVRLPNKRVIAVDAKVPLTEYTLAANETDEARRRDLLELHAKALKRHIDT